MFQADGLDFDLADLAGTDVKHAAASHAAHAAHASHSHTSHAAAHALVHAAHAAHSTHAAAAHSSHASNLGMYRNAGESVGEFHFELLLGLVLDQHIGLFGVFWNELHFQIACFHGGKQFHLLGFLVGPGAGRRGAQSGNRQANGSAAKDRFHRIVSFE